MAADILTKCYKNNDKKAEQMMIREIPEYGNSTCLQVAVAANALKVVGHACCQALLTKLWYYRLSPDNLKIYIGACLLIPPLAPFLLTYRENNTAIAVNFVESIFNLY